MELVVGRAHEARGRVADLGVLGDVDQIAARRQLTAAGQAIAVHLGDDGLGEVQIRNQPSTTWRAHGQMPPAV